ncbi:MAG: HAD family hydrolase [Candidatus Acidiferrales bacterium]
MPEHGVGAGLPAVFLDRDGTICEEMGYLNHISRLRVFPFAAGAIARLNRAGLPVVVVTNQSGVARRIFPESLVEEVQVRVAAELAEGGARIDAHYYCPHIKDQSCDCRKPLPGMLIRAAREHALDLGRSVVVGDRYGDVAMAHAAGALGVLVMSGFGRGDFEYHRTEWPRQPDAVVKDLEEAADWILRIMASRAAR